MQENEGWREEVGGWCKMEGTHGGRQNRTESCEGEMER